MLTGFFTIDVHVTMGNVELLVPRGVAVDVHAGAFLGHVEDRSERGAPTTHVLRVTGRVTLGNLEVTTSSHDAPRLGGSCVCGEISGASRG